MVVLVVERTLEVSRDIMLMPSLRVDNDDTNLIAVCLLD